MSRKEHLEIKLLGRKIVSTFFFLMATHKQPSSETVNFILCHSQIKGVEAVVFPGNQFCI